MMRAAGFFAHLPPAATAATDFPRFAARALNRCTRSDLPKLLAALESQPLSGYPTAVAPVLRLLIQTLRQQDLEPAELDAAAIHGLMHQRQWLEQADQAVGLERTPLRPGEPLGPLIDALGGAPVRRLSGQGDAHFIVSAAHVRKLPRLGWCFVDGMLIARPMAPSEAKTLRHTWAVIEEAFGGHDSDEALPWHAELVRIAARNNLEASDCIETLQTLSVDARQRLWRGLLEHLRDGELDDLHRPGAKALEQRLRNAELSISGSRLHRMLDLARSAYSSCREDPVVAEGFCPCTGGDLALYGQWVEVPQVSRQRLLDLTPHVVEYHLRRLAEIENRGADLPMSAEMRRDLRGLRDTCLRRRYAKDLRGIVGVDPLILARQRLRSGHDRSTIERDLRELATRVSSAAPKTTAPKNVTALPLRPSSAPSRATEGGREPTPTETKAPPPSTAFPMDASAERAKLLAERPKPSPLTPTKDPVRGALRAIELPPMPKPPPWRRTTTKPNVTADGLPPMPAPPDRSRAGRPPTVEKVPVEQLLSERPPPRRVRPLTSRIITPGQVEEFYSNAFRELEVLERDLLERGPWTQAQERVDALQAETKELSEAAGPAARSGDESFAVAVQRLQLVQSYLDRVRPLLSKRSAEPTELEPPPQRKRRWFFRSGDDD